VLVSAGCISYFARLEGSAGLFLISAALAGGMEPPEKCLDSKEEEFQAPKSVFAELRAKLVPAEVQEVVIILGQAQIDRNDELHQELGTLLDILREYTAEVDGKAKQWRARFSRDTNRDMITTEIRSFVSALRSKTSTPISLRPVTPHDRSVLSYVLPEHGPEPQSARQLLASRGGSRCGARGIPASVGEMERPGTAEVAGRLAREIAAREGGDGGSGQLSLDAMETEAQRFQQVLKEEEEELKTHIEFLHAVLEAEHERDGLHSVVPTTTDLKDLRDKLQTELSFATAEDRINKSKALGGFGGGARLTPLAPLGHSSSVNMQGVSIPHSLSRGATPLCPAPLWSPSLSRSGLGDVLDDGCSIVSSPLSSRPNSSRILPASAGSGGSGGASVRESLYIDGASSRPLSRCAAAMGLDLDSDEDDFLFGDGDDDEAPRRSKSRSKTSADVLVLDDDDDEPHLRVTKEEKFSASKKSGALAGKAGGVSAGGGVAAGVKGEVVPVVDAELEEQSKALRDLLSGLVSRDTLADPQHAANVLEEDGGYGGSVDNTSSLAAASLLRTQLPHGDAAAASGGGAGGRRVSLGRHRSLIQQARSAGGDCDDAVAGAHSHTSEASQGAAQRSRIKPRVSSEGSTSTSTSVSSTRTAPLRATPFSGAIAKEPMPMGVRGPSRGLGSAGPVGAGAARDRGGLGISGASLAASGSLVSPPTPPTAPRRPLGSGSAGERLRPIYTRPTAAMSTHSSSLTNRNEA
jgi:hypothetical protein